MITKQKLDKMDQCRHLLDAPAPEVVGELIEEIRRLRAPLEKKAEIEDLGSGMTRSPYGGSAQRLAAETLQSGVNVNVLAKPGPTSTDTPNGL